MLMTGVALVIEAVLKRQARLRRRGAGDKPRQRPPLCTQVLDGWLTRRAAVLDPPARNMQAMSNCDIPVLGERKLGDREARHEAACSRQDSLFVRPCRAATHVLAGSSHRRSGTASSGRCRCGRASADCPRVTTRLRSFLASSVWGRENGRRGAAKSAFQDETPTAKLVRQVLGAIAEFDKAMTVAKLRGARERKRKALGKCEGRKSLAEMHPAVVREAKRLARANPKSGERRSLRKIAAELAKIGEALAATGLPSAKEAARAYFARSGQPYSAKSVRAMLAQRLRGDTERE